MKNREFKYKGITFHLNDNNHDYDKYYEGKYILLFWHIGYEKWMELCTVVTKKEALEHVRYLYKNYYYPFY